MFFCTVKFDLMSVESLRDSLWLERTTDELAMFPISHAPPQRLQSIMSSEAVIRSIDAINSANLMTGGRKRSASTSYFLLSDLLHC